MDTIKNYLDHMFLGLPESTKVNKAKEELLSMMEDKYHQLKAEGKSENEAIGIVISDFGNLEEVAEVLGIKDESDIKEDYYQVNLNEAEAFYDTNLKVWPMTGLGVMLCLMGVSMIFLMMALQRFNILQITKDHAAIIGVSMMFFWIAAGVILFVKYPAQLDNFKHLYKENLQLSYESRQFLISKRADESKKFRSRIALSVGMYILAVVPVIMVGGLLEDSNEGVLFLALLTMFLILGLATYNIVAGIGSTHAIKVLLQEEDYSIRKKQASKRLNKIDDIYWLVVVAIYLVWSFTTMMWGKTWIIWPIAAIIYAVIEAIVGE